MTEIPSLVDIETREDCIIPSALKMKPGMVAVELGSYLGGSIVLFTKNLPSDDIEVYAIDNWRCDNISQESLDWSNLSKRTEVFDKFTENIAGTRIKTIVSDTTEAAKQFADKSINYLFFDASHGYEGLVAELNAWLPKLADEAFAFVHDFPEECIRKAVYDVIGQTNCKVVRGGSSVIIKDTL